MPVSFPLGLVCVKCGAVFGTLLNAGDVLVAGKKIEPICSLCVDVLTLETGITPRSPEDWQRLMANG